MSYSPECVKAFEAEFPPPHHIEYRAKAGGYFLTERFLFESNPRKPIVDAYLQDKMLAAFAANWERVRELEGALAELLPYAEEVQDEGPRGAGWKSDALMSAIGKAYSLLEAE